MLKREMLLKSCQNYETKEEDFRMSVFVKSQCIYIRCRCANRDTKSAESYQVEINISAFEQFFSHAVQTVTKGDF